MVALSALMMSNLAIAQADQRTQDQAKAFIQDMLDRAEVLLVGQQGSNETSESLVSKLEAFLRETFDFNLISRLVIGRAWRELAPEQQVRYQEAFGRLIVHRYLRRVTELRDISATITDVVPLGRRDVSVATLVQRDGQPDTKVDWRVRVGEQGPHIIDVTVEGISMVITQRDEFSQLIKKRTLDGFLTYLEDQSSAVGSSGTL
ncbi:MAG: ABC transporter substrate-binding protein [Pseudomonadota bacterium]